MRHGVTPKRQPSDTMLSLPSSSKNTVRILLPSSCLFLSMSKKSSQTTKAFTLFHPRLVPSTFQYLPRAKLPPNQSLVCARLHHITVRRRVHSIHSIHCLLYRLVLQLQIPLAPQHQNGIPMPPRLSVFQRCRTSSLSTLQLAHRRRYPRRWLLQKLSTATLQPKKPPPVQFAASKTCCERSVFRLSCAHQSVEFPTHLFVLLLYLCSIHVLLFVATSTEIVSRITRQIISTNYKPIERLLVYCFGRDKD